MSSKTNYINNYNSLYTTSKTLEKIYHKCIYDKKKDLVNDQICIEYKKDYIKYKNMSENTDYTL